MLEPFVQGFLDVFTFPAFPLMLLGVLIGFVVGVLPGIGGVTALALMLPFTQPMTPVETFAFLLGMLSVTAAAGDITSVLFGVPGEPVSAAVIIDGHPMAKKGEAGRALGAALMSSLVGGIIGAFLLAAAIPIVRPLVLSFGAPEFFAMSLVGVAFVAALSGDNKLKGVLMGGLGLALSMVGTDQQSGIPRYTLGQVDLWDGVPLVAAVAGFFGIPEIIDLWMRGTSISNARIGKLGGVWRGVKDTFSEWSLTLRCSVIGTFLGILPGVGGGVAQWMAYAHSVQSSKDKSGFGKGDVRGVLGPGAAMNSKEGGNLIPLLAFGVPNNVAMALLLGAFLIKGLQPGPSMLTEHLDLTFFMVWLIVVSHVVVVGLSFLFLNQLVKVTLIRGNLLIPGILLLVFLGAFAERNSAFDFNVALVFGLLGLAMVHLDWPRPPIILGLVLGPLIERNLFISYGRYEFGFLARPGVVAILGAGLAVLLLPALRGAAARVLGRKEAVPDTRQS